MRFSISLFLGICLVGALFFEVANAQTTEFSYQGSLTSSGTPANGNYDFEFVLYDALSAGNPLGTTLTRTSVAVTDGTFGVKLDFGNQFPGTGRYLEIRVRQSGGGGFTPLTPRQQIGSSPYAVQSINAIIAATASNANQLGGVAANQYVLTGDSRLSDARPPTAGSSNYIQNSTNLQQTTNFNISGSGRANTLGAIQYNLGVSRFLSSAGTNNVFLGLVSGIDNTTGADNTFLGHASGNANTSGSGNSFVGRSAGFFSETGDDNSFFGFFSGIGNLGGNDNSFFGYRAGDTNSGNNSTLIGSLARFGANGLDYATALGAGSSVVTSNTVKLGRTADRVIAPGTMIVGDSTTARGKVSFYANTGNMDFYMQGSNSSVGINFGVSSSGTANPELFIAHYNGSAYSDRLSITPSGTVKVFVLGSGGATSLCRNASNELSTCSSSVRYKSSIDSFTPGLNLIKKLRPVSFNWTADGTRDMGLVAEEVAEAEPLLTTTNDKGEVEGVKYDRVGVVLVNAIMEQQTQIDGFENLIKMQSEKIELLEKELKGLKTLICAGNPAAEVCRIKEN